MQAEQQRTKVRGGLSVPEAKFRLSYRVVEFG